MIKLRFRIKLIALFSVIFFATSLGSIEGLVLCYGTDGHIHTEITFNGIDCGHFPERAAEPTYSHCLTQFNQDSHQTHNCISCVDIPLSLDFSLKKFNHSTNQRKTSKLRTIFPLLLSVPLIDLMAPSSALSKHLKDRGPTHNLIQNTILLL